MTAFHRFALFATSLSAALMFSGCQPATQSSDEVADDTGIEDIVPVTPETPDVDVVADHDMHTGHEMMAEDTQVTDLLKDYKKSMTRMHDEMMIAMHYNDPDTAFAKGMLGHHRGAIDMAKIQLKYGSDNTIRRLAQQIIDTQQVEVDVLNKWLASHPDTAKPKPNTQAMQAAYANSMTDMHGEMMLGIADPQPDMAFVRGMLPHHIGAVDMAKLQLKYGTDEEMRSLAQSIIAAQQPEVEMMQQWLADANILSDMQNSAEQDPHTGHVDDKSNRNTQQPAS